ncbi:T9SS type A sorting domain-containing protein [Psychroserpens sp. SPM9]|uniref:T9SS type A sorting domain-containing protein n=1 Tax=Psychroserpens sp. SPM9 TaxID=2975598 RepID=UPI0021A8E7B3|nr:T9SS type A sorting domain-containing protein [Psychroserpens sp. SPM9]MDG5490597.1 T9SS type A sorting domain-containing protein [Psychroserpens sp. SPM9]
MNRIVLYIFILLSSVMFCQNIYQGDAVFSTQEELDLFASENYEGIEGNLALVFTGITDLSELSTLESVSGSIVIRQNTAVESLYGLHNVAYIGNDLIIDGNQVLGNLDGFEGLSSIGGNLQILNNSQLSSIEGLRDLREITGFLEIISNSVLTSLDGLNSIETIGTANGALGDCGPSSGVENASLTVACNNILEDCCLINRLLGIVTGVVNISNNSGGCGSIDEVEESLVNCLVDVKYPKGEDVYVAGRNIKIVFDIIPISTNLEMNYEYSIDNGNTWLSAGLDNEITTTEINSKNFVDWISPNNISQPTNTIIRITTNVDGNQIVVESDVFQVHESNHYQNQGFRDMGTTELVFPFQGVLDTSVGWFKDLSSPLHKCMDINSQDWFYNLSGPNGNNGCSKDIRSPLYGKVIFIERNSDTELCENAIQSGYQKQVVIQSLVDKTIAFRVAHLKDVKSGLSKGQIIQVGDVIGKVGGTGTLSTHAHCSLYKNIYEWPMFYDNEQDLQLPPIIEILEIGETFVNDSQINSCQNFIDDYSADLDIDTSYSNIVSTITQCVLSLEDLILLSQAQYTSIFLNLLIGECPEEDRATSSQNNNFFNIDGLETILSIDGNLVIRSTELTNLSGLENLTHVGGDVIIENNSSLSNFCGLYKLIENEGITGQLIINGNAYNPNEEEILSDSSCGDVLSVENPFRDNNIVLYPNPAGEFINIDNQNSEQKYQVSIYDITGKLLKNVKDKKVISLKKISPGIYFARISINGKFIFTRMIIKK